MVGDVTDPAVVAASVAGADAVVLAVGGGAPSLWRNAAQTVTETVAALPQPRPRVIHLGGGATLTLPDGTRILDQPHFPDQYRASARGQVDALDWYRTHAAQCGVTWTYVSPPPVKFAPGERRGVYRTGLEVEILQWVTPVLTALILVLGAQQGEQQRPGEQARGISDKLHRCHGSS